MKRWTATLRALGAAVMSTMLFACVSRPPEPDDALAWYSPTHEAVSRKIDGFRKAQGRWPRDEAELLGNSRIEVHVRLQPAPFVLTRNNMRLKARSISGKTAKYDLTINGVTGPIVYDGTDEGD